MRMQKEKWHAESVDIVLRKLNSNFSGLSHQQAYERLALYGYNAIPNEKRKSLWMRVGNQFDNVLIYVLLFASIITALLQHWVDTGFILAAVVINALIGLIQEGKAEKAIEALRQTLSLQANVVREGKRIRIGAEQLVPGDVVLLASGDKIPADLRLIKTKNLQVQESVLTGESLPIEKNINAINENTSLPDRTSMAYSGTFVTYGTAIGVVTATGKGTEIGRISALISDTPKLTTPLLKQMTIFSKWLAIAILIFVFVIFIFGITIRNYQIDQMFLAAVAIAVAAIPEGLPAIMTIILAVGVTRMAKQCAIIRRLPAVETLSSVTVICTDKTGTLTKNELTIQKIITSDNSYSVTGSGYNANGKILLDKKEFKLNSAHDLSFLIRAGVLCNDAAMQQDHGTWSLHGSPIDGAFLSLGFKAGINYAAEANSNNRIDFIPFESSHKFMASLHRDCHGHAYIYLKGAPEIIIKMCSTQLHGESHAPLDKSFWHAQINQLAKDGMRVIGLAYRQTFTTQTNIQIKDIENNHIFLGLVGIIDPPRDETNLAVSKCKQAGICVKIITGDHCETACAVGKQVGIQSNYILTGDNLDEMDDNQLSDVINDVNIYARTMPEHKLRIIKALRKHNHIIAMTGDGINDAPALHHADIGIAMGIKGTDVAKEAAEIILADDNFYTITSAIEEARTVYDNLKKIILFILPNDAAEGICVFLAILFGYTLPITPLQILWVNLVTAVTLGLALAFEPPEKKIMQRNPRNIDEKLLSPLLLWRIFFVSFLFFCSMFGLFLFEIYHGSNQMIARTSVVNLLVLAESLYLINCRKIFDSTFNKDGILGSPPVLISIGIVLILQISFTYLPFMQNIFDTQGIGVYQWSYIIGLSLMIYFMIELEKYLLKKYKSNC